MKLQISKRPYPALRNVVFLRNILEGFRGDEFVLLDPAAGLHFLRSAYQNNAKAGMLSMPIPTAWLLYPGQAWRLETAVRHFAACLSSDKKQGWPRADGNVNAPVSGATRPSAFLHVGHESLNDAAGQQPTRRRVAGTRIPVANGFPTGPSRRIANCLP